jgi:hypothetical protein
MAESLRCTVVTGGDNSAEIRNDRPYLETVAGTPAGAELRYFHPKLFTFESSFRLTLRLALLVLAENAFMIMVVVITHGKSSEA